LRFCGEWLRSGGDSLEDAGEGVCGALRIDLQISYGKTENK